MAIVHLEEMRALLLPGLRELQWSFAQTKEIYAADVFNRAFVPATPHIWVPKLSVPMAVAVGVAATVINNPQVTRRFWSGWHL